MPGKLKRDELLSAYEELKLKQDSADSKSLFPLIMVNYVDTMGRENEYKEWDYKYTSHINNDEYGSVSHPFGPNELNAENPVKTFHENETDTDIECKFDEPMLRHPCTSKMEN